MPKGCPTDLFELLECVVSRLENMGIDYCVTGSVASMACGESRFTNDIDIAVRLTPTQAESLAKSFPEDEFNASDDAAREAAALHTQFNVIHPKTGLKIDFMVASDDAFNESRFNRIQSRPILDNQLVLFASPEDVIIRKLEYDKLGGSEKHLRDIRGIISIQGDQLDHTYIQTWASRLGVESEWKTAASQ